MITKRTVFVLGAGISQPYGFPSGANLKKAIWNGAYSRSGVEIKQALHYAFQYQHILVEQFFQNLSKSPTKSIDAWLEDNRGYMDIGKVAISLLISAAEYHSLTHTADPAEDWFSWLWQVMRDQGIENLASNNVTFVTFNYDRLLEHKFLSAIDSSYVDNKNRKAAQSAVLQKIIHVHGALAGGLSDERNYGLYSAKFLSAEQRGMAIDRLVEDAKHISIVCESVESREELARAKSALSLADQIIFLGFGYDARNVQRLEPMKFSQEILKRYSGPNATPLGFPLTGTAMGFKDAERAFIENNLFYGKIILDRLHDNAVEFCRANVILT